MTGLVWWMRAVGALYLFLFVACAVLRLPIKVEGPRGIVEGAASGDPVARYVLDSWVMIGLIFIVLGGALIVASCFELHHSLGLVWAVIALEFVAFMGIDVFKLFRKYDPKAPAIWLVIHAVVVGTGLWFIHHP
ncbi:MAG TPA: hypothetical protein VF981_03060 [Gemmatimonadaceae bacterium]